MTWYPSAAIAAFVGSPSIGALMSIRYGRPAFHLHCRRLLALRPVGSIRRHRRLRCSSALGASVSMHGRVGWFFRLRGVNEHPRRPWPWRLAVLPSGAIAVAVFGGSSDAIALLSLAQTDKFQNARWPHRHGRVYPLLNLRNR